MKLKIYEDIEELPIFNWFKVHATGDLSWILLKKKQVTESEFYILEKAWTKLYDEYISVFGFNELFLTILKKKAEIAELKIERAETEDDSILTFIELREIELKKKEDEMGPQGSFYEIKAHVEKKMGFQIDIRRMSVMEFYTTLKTLNKNG